ncbi:MAG: DcrB-related protein [bacterium]|nr:DUF1795 domain-containing protein [bacterium]MBU1916743.1 DUF1795 domain-containing protein [bacterium]
MKRSVLIFILILFSTTAFASVELKPITHDKDSYSISLPTNWEYSFNHKGASFFARRVSEGARDSFRENLSVISETLPIQITAEQYYQNNLVTMKKMLKEFSIDSFTKTKIGNRDMIKLVSSYLVGMNKVKAKALFAMRGMTGYVVTITSLETDFNNHEAEFDEILNTFMLP